MTEPLQFQHARLRGTLTRDESMARHVSWRAGGVATLAFKPADVDDLIAFLQMTPVEEPVYFVGLGSNLLVRDGGFRGTVVFCHGVLDEIQLIERNGVALIQAQAGVAAPKVSRFAARHDLIGAEFMAGIPGTVGGALAMNAGCYGGETWDVVESVTTLDRAGVLRERSAADFEIDYRHVVATDEHGRVKEDRQSPSEPPVSKGGGASVLTELSSSSFLLHPWFIAARFRFSRGDGDESRRKIKDFLSLRIATQPLGLPNAGSVFRNPPGDHAARLIEASGLKGYTVGGAQVSMRHANFIVNQGAASAADIEAVIEHVRETVLTEQGVNLMPEVRIIGEAPVIEEAPGDVHPAGGER